MYMCICVYVSRIKGVEEVKAARGFVHHACVKLRIF